MSFQEIHSMPPVLLQNLSGPCQTTENIETEGLLMLHGSEFKVNKRLSGRMST